MGTPEKRITKVTQRMQTKQTVGIGIIGMGWMGMTHARAYRQIADRFHDTPLHPKLIVCADDVPERTTEAKSRFGFERTTTDFRDVIADEDVQVVNIAAPNSMHLEIVEAATAAGKHIFCEKPVGRNPAETQAIYTAAAAGRCPNLRRLQLQMGTRRPIRPTTDFRRKTRKTHPLSWQIFRWLRKPSASRAFVAVSERDSRIGNTGGPALPCD